MKIKMNESGLLTIVTGEQNKQYHTLKGQNGVNYVVKDSVGNDYLNVVSGNSKTGEHVVCFNLPIEYTCKHNCECYSEKKCYACGGYYLYGSNMVQYAENFNFFTNHDSDTFIQAVQIAIDTFNYSLFRFFTCGDIPNTRFLECMVQIAKNNPDIHFWSYTKKYEIVNRWIDNNGDLPENLVIIFFHWLNNDGSYFPMDNPHNLPTSEFIPFGMEELTEEVTYICPCSDPDSIETCETCKNPCYKLKKGQSQALKEHSTTQTYKRDKEIKAAKKALKDAEKAAKKTGKKAS